MSLKYKLGLMILALFVVSVGASLLVNRFMIIPSFVELERQQAERNVERAGEAIQRDLSVLSTNVTAWAWWDDSRLFMLRMNDGFVEAELSPEPVASAEVSYMGFYRMDGRQVIHRAPAAEAPGAAGLGELQLPALPPDHPLLRHPDLRGDAKGLIATPQGPMLVAARPILTSSGEGPPAGVLVFGRLLDDALVSRIANQYKLDLRVVPVSGPHGAAPSRQAAADATTIGPVRLDQHDQYTSASITLADLRGDPIVSLDVRTPRTISAHGRQASRIALVTLCIVALAVLGVLMTLIHFTVLRPIAKLTGHAVEVGDDDALVKRVNLVRSDELGVLASEFNGMTDRLAEARRRLIEQSFVSGKAEMAAGILHNLGNAVTPISVRLNSLSDRIRSAPIDDLERAIDELENRSPEAERQVDLLRFVQLAGRDLATILRRAQDDVNGVGSQLVHVQRILEEQERYSHAARLVEPVNIDATIRQAIEGMTPELRRAANIDIDGSVQSLGPVRGSSVEIQQVVSNLVINAAESIQAHCAGIGSIRISGRQESFDGAPAAHLVFADDGGGMQPWQLKQIFVRRFSTKGRGTGLGLHWSANTVAALGGRLYAESAGTGAGAQLHLILPLAREQSADSPLLATGSGS